jgi:hypothetical protein
MLALGGSCHLHFKCVYPKTFLVFVKPLAYILHLAYIVPTIPSLFLLIVSGMGYTKFKEGELKMVELIIREKRGEGRNLNRAPKVERREMVNREAALENVKLLSKSAGFTVLIVDPHDGAVLYNSETE